MVAFCCGCDDLRKFLKKRKDFARFLVKRGSGSEDLCGEVANFYEGAEKGGSGAAISY